MSGVRSPEYLRDLLHELRAAPEELEWVEFKVNKADPLDLGQYVSALSNSAALAGKAFAYLVWGVDDQTHDVVGTEFRPQAAKVGNEELENWLLQQLAPKLPFRFFELETGGKRVVMMEIERALHQPVQFQGQEYVRVGTYKKKLKDFPERERDLWRLFDQVPFERRIAAEHVDDAGVLSLLDFQAYFELLTLPLPANHVHIMEALAEDHLIQRNDAGGWSITNLGAILFARRMADFPGLGRKVMRVVVYLGTDRLETSLEQTNSKGYANGFTEVIAFINRQVPPNEVIGQALRKQVPMYPPLAIRELVANALIHQDFFITGAGPMVEIFANRMEITNPGAPLVAIDRFLDVPPRSRNEALASLMRRMGVCEERGSGIDKVVAATELFQLPAPLFEVVGGSTRSVLFAQRPLSEMDRDDRVRACYLHACLKYVKREFLTNTSLRERFGIAPKNSAAASRLIKEAVEAGAIMPADEDAARKLMKYVPWWAASRTRSGEGRPA
jgi:predicted HTH transcriptional regulator